MQFTVDNSDAEEPGESIHARALGSRAKWRLRRRALVRHWTARLNVITTGGWRFVRVLAAGRAAAAFRRSEVEPLSVSNIREKHRDILIIGFESA